MFLNPLKCHVRMRAADDELISLFFVQTSTQMSSAVSDVSDWCMRRGEAQPNV